MAEAFGGRHLAGRARSTGGRRRHGVDHGNCDLLLDPVTDAPHTQHTTHPVPCMVIDRERRRLARGGGLANVAPTVLQLLGLPRPQAMASTSLLVEALPKPVRAARRLHAA